MFTIEEKRNKIAVRFSSEPVLVHQIIREFDIFMDKYDFDENINTNLVLRELLKNAISHGNHDDKAKKVHCELEITSDDNLKITVEDEGAGFDHQNLNLELPNDARFLSRRGLIIVNALSDNLEFNDEGNRVTALLDLSTEKNIMHTNVV